MDEDEPDDDLVTEYKIQMVDASFGAFGISIYSPYAVAVELTGVMIEVCVVFNDRSFIFSEFDNAADKIRPNASI